MTGAGVLRCAITQAALTQAERGTAGLAHDVAGKQAQEQREMCRAWQAQQASPAAGWQVARPTAGCLYGQDLAWASLSATALITRSATSDGVIRPLEYAR